MIIKKCLFLTLATFPLIGYAQSTPLTGEQPPSGTVDTKTIEPLKVRIIPLGHRRLAQFKKTTKAQTIKIKSPDGDTIEEVIPAGMPVEVMGDKFEYLPPLAYIPQKNTQTGEKFLTTPLILNSSIRELPLKNKGKFDLYIRKSKAQDSQEFEMLKYASATTQPEQSHLLVVLINNYRTKEGWKTPLVKSFDTSPENLGAKEFFVFNGTPFPIEIESPQGSKFIMQTIKPYQSLQLKPNYNAKGRTVVKAKLIAPNGQKQQFFYTSLKLDPDQRGYLMAYFDPRRKSSNPAGMIQFKDTIQPVVR